MDNPKDIQLKIRADKRTISDLDVCCKALGKTRSDVSAWNQKVKTEVDAKK